MQRILDSSLSCSSRFVARLYDQKSFASSHHNINKLRVKLATGRDASLVACAPGRTLHVISEREEHSSWIGKNLRPSLTLLTFPIWSHSSLVSHQLFWPIWKSGNCELFQTRKSLIVLTCTALKKRRTHVWSSRLYMLTKGSRIGKARQDWLFTLRFPLAWTH
jgi:hypothetical protein